MTEPTPQDHKLARKSMVLVAIISIVVPFLAYVYTERFKAMVVYIVGFVTFYYVVATQIQQGLLSTKSYQEYDPVATMYAVAIAAVENCYAIHRARERLKGRS